MDGIWCGIAHCVWVAWAGKQGKVLGSGQMGFLKTVDTSLVAGAKETKRKPTISGDDSQKHIRRVSERAWVHTSARPTSAEGEALETRTMRPTGLLDSCKHFIKACLITLSYTPASREPKDLTLDVSLVQNQAPCREGGEFGRTNG